MQPHLTVARARCPALAVIPSVPPSAIRVHRPVPRPPERRPSVPALSKRQMEAARLAAEGRSNKDIAACLGLRVETVKVHLQKTYRRLGISGRTGLPCALGLDGGLPPRQALEAAAAERGLAPAESAILWHLLHGRANKAIARALKVSVPTVKLRLRAAYRITGTTCRAELAAAVRGWF